MIPEQVLDSLNATIVFLSFCVLWYVLREIGKRLGMALHMPRYYILYDLSLILVLAGYAIGFVVYIQSPEQIVHDANVYWTLIAALYLVSSVITVGVTIRYWGWIVPEVLALRKK